LWFQLLNRPERAAATYLRATEIAPKNGNVWLDVGTAYLQLVENDARIMTSGYGHSAYVLLRGAEILANEGQLNVAENSYKAAIVFSPPLACAHAEYGITLLRLSRVPDAEVQFHLEEESGSHCGLARLGMAMISVVQGHSGVGFEELAGLAAADVGFVQSTLPLVEDAISPEQARSLAEMAHQRQGTSDRSVDLAPLVEAAFTSGGLAPSTVFSQDPTVRTRRDPAPASAAGFYAAGEYARCAQSLALALTGLSATQQSLLASCSFYTGDFRITSLAAARLKLSPATRLEGLYWESKAGEKLAIAALTHAGELEPDSPRMHVLIGDIFRQRRRWSEAEADIEERSVSTRRAARPASAWELYCSLN